jgi:hypothetical protein
MSVLKKISLIVLGFASSWVFAGTTAVTTPCQPTAWGFAVDALYLQPTTTLQSIYPNPWAWGVYLDGFYHYGVSSDIDVNWTHFAPSSQETTNVLVTRSDPRWDAVNLELGQLWQVTEHKHLRWHGGFEYARVDSTSTSTFAQRELDSVTYNSYVSTYNGFGPRLGLDLYYGSDYGLAVYAKGATVLLAGTTQFNAYTLLDESNGAFLSAQLQDASLITVVPELEGRLGVVYDYVLPQGHLLFDLGWMWVNYFNAQSNFVSAANPEANATDFAVQGLSFGVKWRGNAI